MNRLRIASYNIRKCVGLDWKRNPQRIMDVLSEMNADIVVLQEADKRLQPRHGTLPIKALQQQLDYRFAELAANDVSHGWHGNAILYRKPFECIKTDRITIPTAEPRGAVAALFQTASEQRFMIIGTHLSLLKNMRQKQINYLADYASQANFPVIIGGDLNEKKAENWFSDNNLSSLNLITPGNSFHSSKPVLSLDRFIITESITVESSQVHTSPLSKKASDHLPIVMDIQL